MTVVELPPLEDHPFLRTLSAAQAQRLIPCAREVAYDEDAFVFREGDDADTLYLLRAGCVTLEQHVPGRGAVKVESLCAGDILGLSWLFPPAKWTLDARCADRVHAFALRADCVLGLMRDDHALGLEILTHTVQALYQRLVRVRLQRLDVYTAGG